MTAGTRVELLGGPLHGISVRWPADGDEARLPVATIVRFYGKPVEPDDPRSVIEAATYRLLPRFFDLLTVRPVARHLP